MFYVCFTCYYFGRNRKTWERERKREAIPTASRRSWEREKEEEIKQEYLAAARSLLPTSNLLLPSTVYNLFCDQQMLHKVESIFIGPWACRVWRVRTLAPWALVQITGTQNRQKRKPFCSHCSLTAQQSMISLNSILCGFTRVALWLGLSGAYVSVSGWSK